MLSKTSQIPSRSVILISNATGNGQISEAPSCSTIEGQDSESDPETLSTSASNLTRCATPDSQFSSRSQTVLGGSSGGSFPEVNLWPRRLLESTTWEYCAKNQRSIEKAYFVDSPTAQRALAAALRTTFSLQPQQLRCWMRLIGQRLTHVQERVQFEHEWPEKSPLLAPCLSTQVRLIIEIVRAFGIWNAEVKDIGRMKMRDLVVAVHGNSTNVLGVRDANKRSQDDLVPQTNDEGQILYLNAMIASLQVLDIWGFTPSEPSYWNPRYSRFNRAKPFQPRDMVEATARLRPFMDKTLSQMIVLDTQDCSVAKQFAGYTFETKYLRLSALMMVAGIRICWTSIKKDHLLLRKQRDCAVLWIYWFGSCSQDDMWDFTPEPTCLVCGSYYMKHFESPYGMSSSPARRRKEYEYTMRILFSYNKNDDAECRSFFANYHAIPKASWLDMDGYSRPPTLKKQYQGTIKQPEKAVEKQSQYDPSQADTIPETLYFGAFPLYEKHLRILVHLASLNQKTTGGRISNAANGIRKWCAK